MRRKNERFVTCYVAEHDRWGGPYVMVWGGISFDGFTDLYVIQNGALTGVRYRDEILDVYVRPFAGAVGDNFVLRFLSTLWPILQDIAHHIQDKLAISFDSSSIGLISYKWFLTIYDKYSSVKTYNEEDAIFLEKKIPFQNIPNPSSACLF